MLLELVYKSNNSFAKLQKNYDIKTLSFAFCGELSRPEKS